MRRVAISTLLCALVFGILASWLGPKTIAWYASPVAAANVPNCTDAVSWAMGRLVWTQVIGMGVGAVVGLVLGVLLRRKKVAPPPASPAPTKGA